MIIIPIKWLFHWEYTLFSDKPILDLTYRIIFSILKLLYMAMGQTLGGQSLFLSEEKPIFYGDT